MKKNLFLFVLLMVIFSLGCEREDLDDIRKKQEELQEKIDDLEWRLGSLEDMVKWANAEVNVIKSLITALEDEVRIVSYSRLEDNNGYQLVMSDGSKIVLKDGITSIVNVKKHTDGFLYWTLNGDYILDDVGEMIRAEGVSGADGQTPTLRVNSSKHWEVSLDGGASWELILDHQGHPVSAEGKQGAPGKDGDSQLNITETADSLLITYMGVTYVVSKGADSSISPALLVGKWILNTKEVSEDEGDTWQSEPFDAYWVQFNDDDSGMDSESTTFTYTTEKNILKRTEPFADVTIVEISTDELIVEYEIDDKKYRETYDLHVVVTGITISATSHEMAVGDTFTLSAAVEPENATNNKVIWTSNNESIATVDQTGVVIALEPGNVIITATSEDEEKEASCTITVRSADVPVSGVTLSETEYELEVGDSYTLVATISPDNATNKNMTWTSSNPSIVSVVETSGVITALAEGVAIITVTTEDGLKTASCTVAVTEPVSPETTKITFTTTKAKGEQIILRIGNRDWINGGNLPEADLQNFWIDLNNNGVKDPGETITSYETDITFTVDAQTITLYGKVQDFRSIRGSSGNGITEIDLTQNPYLARFEINLCNVEEIDFSKNTELKEVYVRSNKVITSVNVENLSELTHLSLESCDFVSSINVTKNAKLEYLNLDYCRVTTPDISQNTALKRFFYRGAQQLDLATCRQIISDLPMRAPADNARITFDSRVSFLQADKDNIAAKNWTLLQP